MIHYIYCYTNLINNKQYIGQTNNLKRRKKQHIQDSIHQHTGHEVAYNQPIHCAIRKYGIDNFKIEILEIIDTEDWSKVNQLESDYIKKLNSLAPNGYNLKADGETNRGHNKSKIPQDIINNIIQDLKNGDNQVEIADRYQLSRSYISDINNGRCLKQENEKYPLQDNRQKIEDQDYLLKETIENYKSAIKLIVSKPAFSIKVFGMTSKASAYFNIANCSLPLMDSA